MNTETDQLRTSKAAWRQLAREIRPIAWALVAVAAIEMILLALSRGLFETQPFRVNELVKVLMSGTPFLLAAGVVVGAHGWPAAPLWLIMFGRRLRPPGPTRRRPECVAVLGGNLADSH
jgi:hypothetical protein